MERCIVGAPKTSIKDRSARMTGPVASMCTRAPPSSRRALPVPSGAEARRLMPPGWKMRLASPPLRTPQRATTSAARPCRLAAFQRIGPVLLSPTQRERLSRHPLPPLRTLLASRGWDATKPPPVRGHRSPRRRAASARVNVPCVPTAWHRQAGCRRARCRGGVGA